ncbi:hypothetical protein NEUTE2DRAFT_170030 [Neurospora tetrasperma FGSC 2509]|nr:hypothetical protein NEUTE2DRAFT_170030 [Neurospora tetrasperma FGSC 2509]
MSAAPRRSNSTCPRPGSSSSTQAFPTPSVNNGRRSSQYQQSISNRREDWRTDPRDNGRRRGQYQQSTSERREDWRTDPRAQQTPEQRAPPSVNNSASHAQRTTPHTRPAPRRPSEQRSPPNNPRSAPRRPSANNRSSPQSGPSSNKPSRPDEAAIKTQMNQTLSIAMIASPANPIPFPLPLPLGLAMLLVGSSKNGK